MKWKLKPKTKDYSVKNWIEVYLNNSVLLLCPKQYIKIFQKNLGEFLFLRDKDKIRLPLFVGQKPDWAFCCFL